MPSVPLYVVFYFGKQSIEIKSPSVPKNRGAYGSRAEDGTRTRDPNLGKVMLYQLSYFRNCDCKVSYIFQLSKLSFIFLFLLYVFSANENIKQMAVCHNRKLTCCILNSTSVIYICKLLSVSSSIHNFFANSDAP